MNHTRLDSLNDNRFATVAMSMHHAFSFTVNPNLSMLLYMQIKIPPETLSPPRYSHNSIKLSSTGFGSG